VLVEEGVPPLGVEAAELRRERRRRAPGLGGLELAGLLALPLPLLGLLHRRHPPRPALLLHLLVGRPSTRPFLCPPPSPGRTQDYLAG
jgi:hypothetical protein